MDIKSNFFNQLIFCKDNFKNILYLSFYDLKLAYARTYLGPIWQVLAVLISSSLVSVIYSIIFKVDLATYLPKVFIAISIWTLISKIFTIGPTIFFGMYRNILLNFNIPLLYLVLRSVLINFFQFFNFIPIFIIMYFFLNIKPNILPLFFGLIILFICLTLFNFFLATICARFRDISNLLNSITPALTLITPIIWEKELLNEYKLYAYLNPFTSMIEIIKFPLLGLQVPFISYLIVIGIIFILLISTIIIVKLKGKNITYWSI